MAGREVSSSASHSVLADRPLPPTFKSIHDVLSEDLIAKDSLVNVIGVVRDVRPPIPTRNTGGSSLIIAVDQQRAERPSLMVYTDWKCTITIFDKSTEDANETTGIIISVFCPEKDMPRLGYRDAVLIMSAKVQTYRSEIQLLSNFKTEIYVYSASAIPMPPKSAKDALKPRIGFKTKQPGDKEHEYVSWMYHALNKDTLPTQIEFEEQASRSLNIREKFSLLKDVGDGGFYDLIVEVTKDPYDFLDKVTMWVTDYTENKDFFNHSWDSSNADSGRDGDPYGYTSGFQNPTMLGWPGPFGRRCVQLTCWEPHARHLRSQVRAGKWIKLRNLQVKFGRNGGNLEGFLREDRQYPSRLGFEVLELSGSSEDVDPRLKEAIKRKLEYNKKVKQQKKAFTKDEDFKTKGGKRKGNGEPPVKLNSKQRRKLQRAQVEQKVEKQQVQKAEMLGLNKQVTCESEDQPVSSLDRILDGASWKRTGINGEEHVALPFTNIKFRANVRVVDFRPRRLEDFAAWRKVTEFDCLSDYDGASESESDGQDGTLDNFAARKTWEWRFALELEDASPKAKGEKPERIWALVDNYEAQQLTNIDAVDLHADPDQLSQLREQLFKLWGNLEECKRPEYDAHLESIRRANALEPPPDSSDNEAEQASPNQPGGHRPMAKVSNKPFTCCLQQYGLEMPKSDPTKCDAGEGKRYQRLFKLFGTRVR
ncbi:telomere-binding alpha subunit central domain-containing protein [Apiospora phragmitis]|uniref:Protection of telomeres protein 1 n=1 Tax=Apiospora phragmitis TaxID=2905665 RepID=A0ABR1SUY0_9PEZI